MFAVIRTGGKQYKVVTDDVITVERLDAEPGATIALDEVLMLGGDGADTVVGSPLVAGASVSAEVVEQARGPKLIVFKKKRRKNYRRKNGHRQDLTVLRITAIAGGTESAAEAGTKADADIEAATVTTGGAEVAATETAAGA